ncbi:Phospholipid scramblase family protein [Lasiodiplodia hormozganensis]|uniref:Phospholipid scramblase n=1 Tax=Lasiodiplodia hormozganensis TaxID=869390 RepID=A0AA39Z2V3_9PEZI|nr:Phospholipid scramblase family protein [Lasiodiplodia hormozganensis]
MDGQGNHIGYLAERENGFGGTMARQMFKTHRSFTTHVFDKNEREVLRFHRPFSWINSKIRIYDCINSNNQEYAPSDALNGTSVTSVVSQSTAQISPLPLSAMRIIGEAQQQWAPLRRKYNLFLARDASTMVNVPQLTSGDLPLSSSTALQPVPPSENNAAADHQSFLQFAHVNEPWLSWDFTLMSDNNQLLGSVNRNFAGFAREIFTDTGVYALRMDAAALAQEPKHLISHTGEQNQGETGSVVEHQQQQPGMTLDQRAVMLATAVSIDFDYFSRHSGAAGGFGLPIPIWLPGGGGAAAEGAAAGGAAEGVIAGEAGAGAAGRAIGGVASSESVGAGVAGAGTMVGYEAMQRGRAGQQQGGADDASPVANNEPWTDGAPGQGQGQQQGGDVWGEQDPWGGWGKGGDGPPPSGGSSGGGGGDGGGFDWGDFF